MKSLSYTRFNDFMNEVEDQEKSKYKDAAPIKLLDLLSKSSEAILQKYFKSLI